MSEELHPCRNGHRLTPDNVALIMGERRRALIQCRTCLDTRRDERPRRPNAWAPIDGEDWLPIAFAGTATEYEISSLGRVRRQTSDRLGDYYRVVNGWKHSQGYLVLTLYVNGEAQKEYIHRLVMAAFVGPCAEGVEVNHLDGDKQHNALSNLEYVTRQQNSQHAYDMGLNAQRRGEQASYVKYSEAQVLTVRRLARSGLKFPAIAQQVGIPVAYCRQLACRNGNWAWLEEPFPEPQ